MPCRIEKFSQALRQSIFFFSLNTYFSCMKIDPKYTFLHVFFLIWRYVLSKICQYDQKHTLFSNFERFGTP